MLKELLPKYAPAPKSSLEFSRNRSAKSSEETALLAAITLNECW
jgi:hypothetical protein